MTKRQVIRALMLSPFYFSLTLKERFNIFKMFLKTRTS